MSRRIPRRAPRAWRSPLLVAGRAGDRRRRRVRPGGRCAFAVFGTAGLFTATAEDTFDAILDTRSGTDVGVGAQVAWQSGMLRGLFVEFDASRFEETGERVFVHEGEVFPLGIPLTDRPDARSRSRRAIVSTQVRRTARRCGRLALRLLRRRRRRLGRLLRDGRRRRDRATASLPGTSWAASTSRCGRRLQDRRGGARTAGCPDGLGAGGVSDAFNETDLGGSTFRVRIGVGF